MCSCACIRVLRKRDASPRNDTSEHQYMHMHIRLAAANKVRWLLAVNTSPTTTVGLTRLLRLSQAAGHKRTAGHVASLLVLPVQGGSAERSPA